MWRMRKGVEATRTLILDLWCVFTANFMLGQPVFKPALCSALRTVDLSQAKLFRILAALTDHIMADMHDLAFDHSGSSLMLAFDVCAASNSGF